MASAVTAEVMNNMAKNLSSGLPKRHWALRFLLSLRMLLALFCVVAITASSLFAWYFTYLSGMDTADNLTREFQEQMLPLITDEIQGRLQRFAAT